MLYGVLNKSWKQYQTKITVELPLTNNNDQWLWVMKGWVMVMHTVDDDLDDDDDDDDDRNKRNPHFFS